MAEELGYGRAEVHPLRASLVTFAAFVLVGFIPLAAFVCQLLGIPLPTDTFLTSSVMTAAAFFGVGAFKSRFVVQHWWRSGLETLTVGGTAAAIAYAAGMLLKNVAG